MLKLQPTLRIAHTPKYECTPRQAVESLNSLNTSQAYTCPPAGPARPQAVSRQPVTEEVWIAF
jgi:hypothetical protein